MNSCKHFYYNPNGCPICQEIAAFKDYQTWEDKWNDDMAAMAKDEEDLEATQVVEWSDSEEVEKEMANWLAHDLLEDVEEETVLKKKV